MILVGGQSDCEKPKVQIMKQFVPVPYYIPRPVYKYILRHHYVPIRQVVMKPYPVPYPSYGHGNEHSYGGYSGGNSQKSYGGHGGYEDYGNNYASTMTAHAEPNYGQYPAFSKATSNYGTTGSGAHENYDNYAAGSSNPKYSSTASAGSKPTSGAESAQEDAYYGGMYSQKDYNGVYKNAYDSNADGLSSTSMQIESFLKQSSPSMMSGDYSPKDPVSDATLAQYMNNYDRHYSGTDDYDSKASKSPISHSYLSSTTSTSSSSSSPSSSSSSSSSSSISTSGSSNVSPKSTPSTVTYLSGAFGMPSSASLKTGESQTSTSWKRLEKKIGKVH